MAGLDLAMGAEVASGSRCVVVAISHDRELVVSSCLALNPYTRQTEQQLSLRKSPLTAA